MGGDCARPLSRAAEFRQHAKTIMQMTADLGEIACLISCPYTFGNTLEDGERNSYKTVTPLSNKDNLTGVASDFVG